ncbi:MAG: AIR synthase-related protein [Deltaproteobacteria bacterium]
MREESETDSPLRAAAEPLRETLLRRGRRRWLETPACEARGSFAANGFRLDQGARVLMALGEESGAALEEKLPQRLGALMIELAARGAEPAALFDGIRIAELEDPGAARARDTIVRALADHAERLEIPVFAGEIAHVAGVSPAVSLFLVGVLARSHSLEEEQRGQPGDRVFRLCLTDLAGQALAEAQKALAACLRAQYEAGALCFVGSCADGALIGAADWIETAACGLRLDAARWGTEGSDLTTPAPLEFLVSVGEGGLPEGLSGLEVGVVLGDPKLEIVGLGEGLLVFSPEDLRRGSQAASVEDAEDEPTELHIAEFPEPADYGEALQKLLATPVLRSRRPIFARFARREHASVRIAPGADAGAFVVGGPRDLLVASVDSAARFSALDPYIGACLAVVEATRNLTAVGAESLGVAVTIPGEGPPMASLVYDGLRHAADALGTTIELARAGSGDDAVPTVLALGRPVADDFLLPWFRVSGDLIVLLGHSHEEVGGSAYAAFYHGLREGMPPWVDLGAERRLQDLVRSACARGLLHSAHDLSAGGLGITLVEACCGAPAGVPRLGARIDSEEGMRPDAWLFGESQARMLLSLDRESLAELRDSAIRLDVPLRVIGEVGGDVLEVGSLLNLSLAALEAAWDAPIIE